MAKPRYTRAGNKHNGIRLINVSPGRYTTLSLRSNLIRVEDPRDGRRIGWTIVTDNEHIGTFRSFQYAVELATETEKENDK